MSPEENQPPSPELSPAQRVGNFLARPGVVVFNSLASIACGSLIAAAEHAGDMPDQAHVPSMVVEGAFLAAAAVGFVRSH